MTSRKKPAPDMPLSAATEPDVFAEISALADQIVEKVARLELAEQISALNDVRTRLHGVSPFKDEPVDLVLWKRAETVVGYDEYENPNFVSPPELALLTHSMHKNGVALALVTHETDLDGAEVDVVVDGMHRRKVGTHDEQLRARLHGYLPVSRLRAERADVPGRIAATVEFNRARGEHAVDRMASLVRLLHEMGWPDDKIQQELGMQIDEVTRLKLTTGIAALFREREFSEAWDPVSSPQNTR
jgi:hypothetical protein